MKKFFQIITHHYEKFKQKQEIKLWLQQYGIKKYKILPDMSVDVDGNVTLFHSHLTSIPFQFNQVNGNFTCAVNELTSLRGCPRIVTGDFDCSNNLLTSLEFCPEKIGRRLFCSNNDIKNLEFFPTSVTEGFICSGNLSLTSSKEGVYSANEAHAMHQTFLDIKHEKKSLTNMLPDNMVKSKKNHSKI